MTALRFDHDVAGLRSVVIGHLRIAPVGVIPAHRRYRRRAVFDRRVDVVNVSLLARYEPEVRRRPAIRNDRNGINVTPSRRRLDVRVEVVELLGDQRYAAGEDDLVLVRRLVIVRAHEVRGEERERFHRDVRVHRRGERAQMRVQRSHAVEQAGIRDPTPRRKCGGGEQQRENGQSIGHIVPILERSGGWKGRNAAVISARTSPSLSTSSCLCNAEIALGDPILPKAQAA